MKLTKVVIREDDNGLGLGRIELSRLGNIVVLAGKNGSGKTRILKAVQRAADSSPETKAHEAQVQHLGSYHLSLLRAEEAAAALERAGDQNSRPTLDDVNSQIASIRKSIKNAEALIERYKAIETDVPTRGQIQCVEFLPKQTRLADDRVVADVERDARAKRLSQFGADNLSDGTIALIREVQTAYFEATHPNGSLPPDLRKQSIENYDRLDDLIYSFLGVRLARNTKGLPTLFGSHPSDANLSDGQIILLQLCVQLYAQSSSLKDVVLFLDEPENHLHPAACIDMIEDIRRKAPTCQVWIATHSLPLISYFIDATLLFVEDGKASFAGSLPDRVFESLLGGEERIGRLRDFLSLPELFAMNRFGAECLLPPTVIGATERDDQTAQIRNHLDQLRKRAPEKRLRILDYGAGKGRLLENLAGDWPNSLRAIEYVAFDPYPEDAEVCKKTIAAITGSADGKYFNTHHELKACAGPKSFDVIVMCNVFHEIDPIAWTSLFGQDGDLSRLLVDDGAFLIVEDEEMPTGELAHAKGFIVLDTAELRAFF